DHAGSAALATVQSDAPARLFDDLLADGKPEAGAAGLGRKERIEDAPAQRLGNPRAGVGDGDEDGRPVELAAGARAAPPPHAALDEPLRSFAGSRRLAGVEQDVPQHLL